MIPLAPPSNLSDVDHEPSAPSPSTASAITSEVALSSFDSLKPTPTSPDGAYERHWALALLGHAMERLRGEYPPETQSTPLGWASIVTGVLNATILFAMIIRCRCSAQWSST